MVLINVVDMKKYKLTLEITEAPKGIFNAQIKEIRGAVIASDSEDKAIEEVFKQAWLCIKVDHKNFKCS